ncbi:MAG: tRNA (adenosine(37)-N6)-dimethylallyltransferase MiaA [Aquificae bacterium]|nr:tRNA (adenosine(37)-N6)-dimethylallyltransferase MiaA [Aquificota bacterium]
MKRLLVVNLIIITGATATGKTDLAIELAKKINGEIISADSMMVYKYMDIGTAKPSIEERQGIPHYLIDVVEPSQDFSAKDFVEKADKKIKEIKNKGKIPIIVGGTWLYIQALLYGLAKAPEGDWEIREKLYAEDTKKLYEELKKVDPDYANKIHFNDKKRIIRALEVFYITNKPFSQFLKEHSFAEKRYRFCGYVINRPKENIMERIEKRVEKMLEMGLIEETENLLKMGFEKALTSMQAIGYKELIPYIKGEKKLDEAKGEIIKNTKKFAKRQLRAFRSKFNEKKDWEWLDISSYTNEEVLDKIIKKYYQK